MPDKNHTLGPWKADIWEDKDWLDGVRMDAAVIGKNGYPLAYTGKDDARLIAAAPELLEACKLALAEMNYMVNYTNCISFNKYHELKPMLEKLIAKAEGNE
jgi:hypothetical protein